MRVSAEQQIHIEQLKVFARVGVPQTERAKRQRLVLNITLWPARDLRDLQDRIAQTVDYSALCRDAKDFLSRQSPKLRFRECDAERVSTMICVRDVFNNH